MLKNSLHYYQLNLNIHKFKENIGEKNFYFKEDKTNELLIENLKVVHKSLDYYSNLYYNKNEKLEKDEIWLVLINAKSLKELKEMANFIMEEKEQEKFMNDVEQTSKDKLVLSEWESEKMNELVKRESLKLAINEGIEQGRTEGINQTIIAMFNQNIDLETISKITNKSIEEIKTILNKN